MTDAVTGSRSSGIDFAPQCGEAIIHLDELFWIIFLKRLFLMVKRY
jgi:hypothetical protein